MKKGKIEVDERKIPIRRKTRKKSRGKLVNFSSVGNNKSKDVANDVGKGEDNGLRKDELKMIIKDSFLAFDTKKDQVIDAEEFKQVMKSLGENLSDSEIKAILNLGDTKGNGVLDFEEFNSLMIKLGDSVE